MWTAKNKPKAKIGAFFSANATWVCEKHGYSARRAGLCPTCRGDLKCMGYRWRIGRHGDFRKVENFTKAKADRRKVKGHW